MVDERGELFPDGFGRGFRTDVLHGFPKEQGIDMVLRTMSPTTIAVDEITAEADCQGLLRAANCGVRLLATAHAASVSDFRSRGVYKPLADNPVFSTLAVLQKNNTYTIERMTQWNSNGLVHF